MFRLFQLSNKNRKRKNWSKNKDFQFITSNTNDRLAKRKENENIYKLNQNWIGVRKNLKFLPIRKSIEQNRDFNVLPLLKQLFTDFYV